MTAVTRFNSILLVSQQCFKTGTRAGDEHTQPERVGGICDARQEIVLGHQFTPLVKGSGLSSMSVGTTDSARRDEARVYHRKAGRLFQCS